MSSTTTTSSQLPCGAEIVDGGVDFRVWYAERAAVHVVLVDAAGNAPARRTMDEEPNGFFSILCSGMLRMAASTTFNWTMIQNSIRDPVDDFNHTACTALRR